MFPAGNRQFSVGASPDRTARELVEFLEAKLAPGSRPGSASTRNALPAGYQIWHNAALLAALYQRPIETSRQARGVKRHEQPA